MAKQITKVTLRRLARLGFVLLLSMLLASCSLGGDDDNPEPTETSESEIESQPTQVAEPTSEPTESGTPDSSFVLIPSTPESGGDVSSPETVEGTPLADDATREATVEPTEVPETTPTTDAVADDVSSTPAVPGDGSANDTAETPVSGSGSDGTSGPGGAGGLLENPDASPVADPADGEDASTADSTEVDSCDVVEAPPFSGDSADFVTAEEVNFRLGPGSDCDTLLDGPLTIGIAVTVLSDPVVRSDDPDGIEWVQVDVDGEIGWIATEFIEPAE